VDVAIKPAFLTFCPSSPFHIVLESCILVSLEHQGLYHPDGGCQDRIGMQPKPADSATHTLLTHYDDLVAAVREDAVEEEAEHVGQGENNDPPDPRILIIGCGGSGNNTLNRISHLGVEGAVTVAVNTDKQHLDHTVAQQKLLVGKHITRGLGAGGDPAVGRRCAEAARGIIRNIVSNSSLVFICTGLGGGSGTGIAPVIAEEAKAAGALVVGIVTTPFHVEKSQRMARAMEGLAHLRDETHAVLVLDNNRLLTYVPNLPLDEAFSILDQLIAEIVKSITETITLRSLINLDFADVRTILSKGGVTMMMYGESDQGPEEVVSEALNHPLLDIDIAGATGVLIHITGGVHLTLEQSNRIVELMTSTISEDANVIFGARQDPTFGRNIKIMAIVTGVGGSIVKNASLSGDKLGEALNIARQRTGRTAQRGFQHFT